MLKQENLAANFCGLLALQSYKEKAIEWKLLGQEKDGSLLSSWTSYLPDCTPRSNIGIYNPVVKSFDILYSFKEKQNVIQASVNNLRTLLLFVTKDLLENGFTEIVYKPYIVRIKTEAEEAPLVLLERNKQIMTQFLWKNQKNSDIIGFDKFIVMIHTETILLYTVDANSPIIDVNLLKNEIIVRTFKWAQFDPVIQCLYYIHLKLVTKNLLEKEENRIVESTPSLSAYQFNDNLPTETVLNIPLNLPKLPSNSNNDDDVYEDDTIPLRIHDSSLNLNIVSDDIGMLFVCHYYLYKPVKPEDSEDDSVHFAYSVTVIHHGLVIHCVIPGIKWDTAKLMKPTFSLHGDHHMLVFQAGLFMHLLDVGITHEPCCHIVCPPLITQNITHLIPFLKWGSLSIDSYTLDLISINIPKSHLIEAFKQDNSVYNRLSIIHYFLVHSNDMESLVELLNIIIERPLSLDTVSYLKEALIAGTYASVSKSLPQDASELISLLPLTTSNILRPVHAKVSNLTVGLSHEKLHNTTMMLLSPQQRLSPYRTDIWTRLWEKLNSNRKKSRFSLEEVADKLMYSLACYQPEVLSRSSTPLTPGPTEFSSSDLCSNSRHNINDILPFIEFETCTASKQEHVISVNLRELSVYLVKNHAKYNTGFRWLKNTNLDKTPAPVHVHIVASQYATDQLELSRSLCVIICRAAGIDARVESVRGFALIDQMSNTQQYTLFHILERYYLAAESLAFPVPQGFSSFFVYLGFRVLSFETFLQYAQTNVFELQIDVMKVILTDIDDSKQGIKRKLSLLLSLPQQRSRRLLNYWNHPISLILRGRDHALNILSGNPVRIRTNSHSRKSAMVNTGATIEKLSPLDTFLDLLTAKASLNNLDFDLLIESTLSSLEDFPM